MFHKCKITVIRRTIDTEMISRFLKPDASMRLCNKMKENQSFIVNNPYDMPFGMCSSAWADIRTYIITIAAGGTFSFMNNERSILATCSDIFRPVTFLIEQCEIVK